MKKAFTLAEVLVTLGIIGVISALIIPAIVQNYRYKLYSTQFKKTVGQLIDAANAVMSEEETSNFYQTTAGVPDASPSADFPKGKGTVFFLDNYFRVARKNCNTRNENGCVATKYHSLAGDDAGSIPAGVYCIQLISGAAVCMIHNNGNHVTTVFFDTNGSEPPNTTGLDMFIVNYRADGSLRDWSDDGSKCNTKFSSYGHPADYASGCYTKVIGHNWQITD